MCRPWPNNEVQVFLPPPWGSQKAALSAQSSTTVPETGRLIRSVIVLREQWRLKWANAQPGGIRDSFPPGAAVVLETLLQVYGKTHRDCELIPLSPGFNYPQTHGFKIFLYTTLGLDWGQAMEKGDKLI